MQSITEIYSQIFSTPLKIGIVMHQKPDADAMGSSLGLANFLLQFGHEITVVSPTNWPQYLDWTPGSNMVIDYEKNKHKAENALLTCNWLFCLDFNDFSRTKRMQDFLKNLNCTKVLIDHHQQPQVEAFDYGISDTRKSSTCEMIYDFIIAAGKVDNITIPITECLYSGAMTDTGSFRFPSTTASVHKMVAHLKELGLQHSKIHDNIFDNYLENRLRFMGHVLTNCMEVFYEYNTVLISIPNSDLVKYQITTGDTEGLVNLPQSIKGIKLVAIIIDRYEEIKMSFRSKGDVDVNAFARKYFNGGGHKNASGGGSKKSLSEAVADFKIAMKESAAMLQ